NKKNTEGKGVVYILTNPSFPEYVKIGYADNLQKRLKELNRSECIPYAFRVFATYEVNERLQDKALHNMIDGINPNLRAIETFDGKKRKKEFYAMSSDDAYAILQTIATVSGTINRLHKLSPEGHEIIDEQTAEDIENSVLYSEDSLLAKGDEETVLLYKELKKEIKKLDKVIVEPKKLYIAFKSPKNFADIEIQKHNLKIFINMPKGSLIDPNGIAQDVSDVGHWGNGDYRIYLTEKSKISDVMELIKQSYSANKNRDSE
ncbi:MAG: GIY-YIG nuclease family protein, partial [Fibrobacter sp.]|nr:GIY-YIG nuclease family protein [Fibrobacter sp.]